MSSNYILMIFEGERTERIIFDNLKQYFLDEQSNTIVYGFHCGDIYSLYHKVQNDNDLELFSLLKEDLIDKNPELQNIQRDKVSELYLFFDYDGHATASEDNKLDSMLELCDNETEDFGKLYISYPMVEAIKHLKANIGFEDTVAISQREYKNIVSTNCENYLKDISQLTIEHWEYIINEHCSKANLLVNGNFIFPVEIIEQIKIFNNQKEDFISKNNTISVLSSFPIFLLDYYGSDDLINKIREQQSI